MKDAEAIIARRKSDSGLTLRPHYQNLVHAYEDEFVYSRGLRDEKLITFFDRYIHDSLAGFAIDATLPSDPRVIYVGGDDKLRFASVQEKPAASSPGLAA
ncbi:MAG: hypothetical protein CGU28_14270 [Candidatus Dactylopiibacterium carminicum]|uniref:Uncharacterized protein n=1 Tax=Candidatus Dactylopiibacterium carminicum TaxID=857335 RepID=A0A272ENR0_9RHOO|nr:hypothetical protein [Candidatus Dactylopiibacterium carminicum]KAF7598138.1 hypothetical protein BGI27_14940 [Candidatus Dactylopiibacterium carminicum]PAS91757.1 MAG: hypothetical protein CGU29_14655 [Candidatus Dactylopiibacterium carminicum]PAS94128.1 MAG: hypothetical protein CGU28_14270 [Candidatus Dactylopiibacterium carminicum]PAS96728.1 MAG: hypothetical protein BSR46_14980 [Candidatus Dactylopiibacterium carminicum]